MRAFMTLCTVFCFATSAWAQSGLKIEDVAELRSVGGVRFSPDGERLIYSVTRRDRPGTAYSETWIRTLATGESIRLDGGGARWSPDGKRIAYTGRDGDRSGIVVSNADGSEPVFLAVTQGTNHPLPSRGEGLSWAPDSRKIAFLSTTPGPENPDTNGDPVVITRYLYKPPSSVSGFNDNRRLHIFTVDVETKEVEQITDGTYYEHSIDWSPDGERILFVSNREPDPDLRFNYDIFIVSVADKGIRRLTNTESNEYRPRWSPDGNSVAYQGTRRGLTSSETTMEDTHVWLMGADGSDRRELGASIDNRQGAPLWSPDGSAVYFTVREQGLSRLYRAPVSGAGAGPATGGDGSVGSFAVSEEAIAYTLSTPEDQAQLHLYRDGSDTQLTDLNSETLDARQISEVERIRFLSFDGREVEAFLTHPLGRTEDSRHPMIVMIHGGPHGQQGPTMNTKAQVYAAQGWATLMVNYRGSTGYGQAFADAIFRDQNGGEARDVLSGVDAILRRKEWLDPERLGIEGGSYGGQLTNWIITQTNRFKAAIPAASISNLISFNYMSYYHDYLAVEFGTFPHQENLMDFLWERSPLRYANRVTSPTMFIHGENDNNVPIAEAEQFYIALRDVGVDAIMVRYPGEGHGLRQTEHIADSIERSIAWYRKHFSQD